MELWTTGEMDTLESGSLLVKPRDGPRGHGNA